MAREFDTYVDHLELYSNSPREAEVVDDVANSGVFSPNRANVHVNDGVFATNWALPGYAQRENLLGRSEVIDRQTGTNIEVYVGGATSAMQSMPSTAPRYPWPDRDGYLGGSINKALMQDSGAYPVQDIADMPNDVLGPVTDTTVGEARIHYPWASEMVGHRGPLVGTGVPASVSPRPRHGAPRAFSGVGSVEETVASVPAWGWILGGVAIGLAIACFKE